MEDVRVRVVPRAHVEGDGNREHVRELQPRVDGVAWVARHKDEAQPRGAAQRSATQVQEEGGGLLVPPRRRCRVQPLLVGICGTEDEYAVGQHPGQEPRRLFDPAPFLCHHVPVEGEDAQNRRVPAAEAHACSSVLGSGARGGVWRDRAEREQMQAWGVVGERGEKYLKRMTATKPSWRQVQTTDP